MNNQELRIQELERQVSELKNLVDVVFQYNGLGRTYLKNYIAFDKESMVGFYGKDPVAQQALASDTLANLLTALRNYGIIKT